MVNIKGVKPSIERPKVRVKTVDSKGKRGINDQTARVKAHLDDGAPYTWAPIKRDKSIDDKDQGAPREAHPRERKNAQNKASHRNTFIFLIIFSLLSYLYLVFSLLLSIHKH